MLVSQQCLQIYEEVCCYPPDKPLPVDRKGNVDLTPQEEWFLSELCHRWPMSKQQADYYQDDSVYNAQVLRAVWALKNDIKKSKRNEFVLPMVIDQLVEEERRTRPSIPYLKQLCAAALNVSWALSCIDIEIIDTYHEPNLPTPREKWLARLTVPELHKSIEAHKITENEYRRELKLRQPTQTTTSKPRVRL
jgi:hypothetical protein